MALHLLDAGFDEYLRLMSDQAGIVHSSMLTGSVTSSRATQSGVEDFGAGPKSSIVSNCRAEQSRTTPCRCIGSSLITQFVLLPALTPNLLSEDGQTSSISFRKKRRLKI